MIEGGSASDGGGDGVGEGEEKMIGDGDRCVLVFLGKRMVGVGAGLEREKKASRNLSEEVLP